MVQVPEVAIEDARCRFLRFVELLVYSVIPFPVHLQLPADCHSGGRSWPSNHRKSMGQALPLRIADNRAVPPGAGSCVPDQIPSEKM